MLATPRSKFSWMFPSLAVVGGLGLLFVVGRRLIARGRRRSPRRGGRGRAAVEDDDYADKLDDELAKTD